MAGLAAAIVAGVGAARYTLSSPPRVGAAAAGDAPPPLAGSLSPPPAMSPLLPPPPPAARIALPGDGVLSVLPGSADLLALTVDDGVNSDVVRFYTQFAKDTGVRLTYFANGTYRSWTDNQAMLRPLVDSGQIQLGNHTWSHPDLTTLPKSRIADEITRNDTFLKTPTESTPDPICGPRTANTTRRLTRWPPTSAAARSVRLGIADGYHRVCASYVTDENTAIPCRLVSWST